MWRKSSHSPLLPPTKPTTHFAELHSFQDDTSMSLLIPHILMERSGRSFPLQSISHGTVSDFPAEGATVDVTPDVAEEQIARESSQVKSSPKTPSPHNSTYA